MGLELLSNKEEIEECLRKSVFLHIYEIGDLDPFFWPRTQWFGWKEKGNLKEIFLRYNGENIATILAFSDGNPKKLKYLLKEAIPLLPRSLYAHLSDDLVNVFENDFSVESHGLHDKMALIQPEKLTGINTEGVINLDESDLGRINELYCSSYPENWFDSRMLKTGQYFGIEVNQQLVSIAGIHVYSPEFKVASLGNVTTKPEFRGLGMGTKVCAKLCQELLKNVNSIGLNVKSSNATAIVCYKKLGFEKIASYGEFSFKRKKTEI
ncbi:MAG: GNAT family N-acetyltransferase [Candidatus Riflebacteria bacterium]|nr:GNAT family N-acetyltransferase [Candidatus Riflebacteria bacterium]